LFDLIISIFLRVRWTTLIALIYKNDVFKKAIKIITETFFIHSKISNYFLVSLFIHDLKVHIQSLLAEESCLLH
jgi:hypothetical protein